MSGIEDSTESEVLPIIIGYPKILTWNGFNAQFFLGDQTESAKRKYTLLRQPILVRFRQRIDD